VQAKNQQTIPAPLSLRGLCARLVARFGGMSRPRPRLALLERIALAPRHALVLVEAEGRRFLVATSPEGAAAFYALDGQARRTGAITGAVAEGVTENVRASVAVRNRAARVSW
jgi:hypothetical protein